MKITLNRPHLISWLTMPVLILTGFLFSRHSVDIQLYNTYYVISNFHFTLVASELLFVFGMGYWLLSLTRKTPSRILSAIHLVPSIFVLFLIALPTGSLVSAEWFLPVLIAFLLSQCAFAVNILFTLGQKFR